MKKLSTSEKVMIGLIIMLLVGVILRWELVSTEAGEAIRERLKFFQ